tara:strand:- start:232 stop:576 length:345 start_codon:yes stop_codon:yes gene_type:complete
MNAHRIFLVIVLVFGLIGAIRDNGPVSANDMFFMHVNVNNDGTKDLDDLNVKVLIYDLGILLGTSPFDLNDGDNDGKFVFWNAPDYAAPGDYWARITVSNDDVREVQHRIITIA